MLNWLDQTRAGRLRAYMIPPTNIDDVYGELVGVDWASSSISAGFYTDTRTSGSLKIVNGNFIRNAFVRIVYEIPEWDYEAELGTYAVTNDDSVRENGVWTTTLELHSMLYTLSTDKADRPFVISRGALALSAIQKQLIDAGRQFITAGANNYVFNQSLVMETGGSRLSRIYELCSLSNNRLDVDGHGRVIISPYVAPSARVPEYEINLAAANGIAKPGLSRSSNYLEMPSRVVVAYKAQDTGANATSQEIRASISVSTTDHANAANRGYEVVEFYELSDMSPKTAARAQQIAKEKLAAKSLERVEWSLSCKYLPLWEGSIVDLVIPDGDPTYIGRRKCVVKNVDFKPPYMDMSLTLKETASGDDEEN